MRTTGGLGMSVGTSLAFEQMGSALLVGIDCVLFNLKTLIRNAMQSYESGDTEINDPSQLTKDVESDLGIIAKWLEANRGAKPVRMVVYCPSYTNLKSDYRLADVWEPRTDKQKKVFEVTSKTVRMLLSKFDKLVVKTTDTLPEYSGEGLVLTHHVIDLVRVKGVGRLRLLESHTGAVKPFTEWHTKLTGGNELHYMPFNKLTIQVFGDKSVNFKAQSSAIKELVKKIAVENKWTSATTMSRVRGTINSLPQGMDRTGLLKML